MDKFNLLENFKSTVFNAVTNYFSQINEETSEKLITTSLRLTNDTKKFYECLATEESTSLNTALINTLNKVKNETINHYNQSHTFVNQKFDYQLSSLFKLLEQNSFDYNDLVALFEWLSGKHLTRKDLIDKACFTALFDKDVQQKLCMLFDYNYNWLSDNSTYIASKGEGFERRWYKHIHGVIFGIIDKFYLDKTVEKLQMSFLCSDPYVIQNIVNEKTPDYSENITPILIADRNINGVKLKTYHLFEHNDINYDKCRKFFILLIKSILTLERNKILEYPYGYYIKEDVHRKILKGDLHLSELFSKRHLDNNIAVANLEDVYLPMNRIHDSDNTYTSTPHLYHFLSKEIMLDLLNICKNKKIKPSGELIIDDTVLSKLNMSSMKKFADLYSLVKYLSLYFKGLKTAWSSILFISESHPPTIKVEDVKLICEKYDDLKPLYTSFG